MGNWKITKDDATYLKVINFGVPNECELGGESMWVKKVSGTDNDGVGVLNNIPAFCEEVSLGDFIKYAGGTDEIKPHYAGKVEESFV